MRIAVLIEDRCKPNSNAFEYLKKWAGSCSGECIQVIGEKIKILESACPPCIVRAKHCPDDAVVIINLPSELETDMIHRYSLNGFRLFKLPTPSKDSVVGILGPNGMGKSTAINALSGRIVPNLGDWSNKTPDWEDIIEILPRGELRDFLIAVKDQKIKIAVKPQNVDKIPKRIDGTVGEMLSKVDERGIFEEITKELGLYHLLERKVKELSGGELQRMAICATLMKEADVYFFDEPSSYLDIHQRMNIVKIIQKLSLTKRVIVIEHDLAVLDVLADLVHIVYGKKGAFGVFTPARTTRQAINAYLDGYLTEQNVRIRSKPIKFLLHRDRNTSAGNQILSWGDLEKTLGTFSFNAEDGSLHRGEVVGVVGPNGTGKSTMMKILAGLIEYDNGWVTDKPSVSYKPQHIDVDMDCSVQLWLDSEIGAKWRSGEFNVNVIKALGVDQLLPKRVKKLSGGERQAVSIAICLGRDADLYLLDEPSAHLDANARMEAAKAIRRTMESNEKSALVIDHDVYFIDILSDSLLVFDGVGGQHGKATGPYPLREGMNQFLKDVNITFRRDHDSKRPRINKPESRKDREQQSLGDYYSFDSR
ncbi:MAG TPA: ribosome biogenesis/translation initiation ATPase RLI [Candidatus Poseidoniaceae archaeon]|nr:MAG TPA: ribosome biogenesis/translation initiation ATPase RLI [Candidatus Poseidoniales archaeon]DAC61694.1 MAG TPA: ribosome biogenesis/translation initiation ATPase RLI [Candidatus Poseidoniales archaeon]HII22946.1 ribosome biogenesis/translation initiation ATPase RLI [Candidatus Poseidoniaceae archaeon]HII49733.1 ribosome biogenesis/translation initiation ATPase RLI [Candidatus Poseidoniaceae archaeon]|tara:strand:- start:1007 stop:2779 length:1773 start_codon:yes stop_codon:yes gene_type:complete